MTQEEKEEARLKRLETLKASYEMYENSKEDTKEKHAKAKDSLGNKIYSEKESNKTLKLIETMQQDIFDEYIQLGGDPAELTNLKKSSKNNNRKKLFEDLMKKETMKDEMAAYVRKMNERANNSEDEEVTTEDDNVSEIEKYAAKTAELRENEAIVQQSRTETGGTGVKKQIYDLVKLPSKGQAYKGKEEKLKIAYLTAYDENMILAPGLYEDGTFLDKLLEAKIMDEFNVQELLPGDRDAIVLWLRANGYGPEYPMRIDDPDTGKEIEVVYDLNNVKFKEFNLIGDANGYFDFTLPVSGDVIKFKFLTIGDHKFLKNLRIKEEKRRAVSEVRRAIDKIDKALEDNDNFDSATRNAIKKLSDTAYSEIVEKYDIDNDETFSHFLTDNLILHTISINGVKDRKYISDYITNMNIRDAASYRKYMETNEPGIDYNIQVERPGGGAPINTFLQLSEFIFVNFE